MSRHPAIVVIASALLLQLAVPARASENPHKASVSLSSPGAPEAATAARNERDTSPKATANAKKRDNLLVRAFFYVLAEKAAAERPAGRPTVATHETKVRTADGAP